MFSGCGQAVPDGGHEGVGRVVLVHDRERRIGEGAERHRRHAQEAAERARDVRAEHRCQSQRADADADPLRDRRPGLLDVGQHRPHSDVGSRATSSHGRVTDPRAAPVDLDPAAQDDRLERPALRHRAQHRDHRVVGEPPRGVGCRPGVWLPHCEMHQHMRVEPGHLADDAVVLTGHDTMEDRSTQPGSGGSVSIPSSDPTHDSASSKLAIRDPSSPPIPLMSTRTPAMIRHATRSVIPRTRFGRALAVFALTLACGSVVRADVPVIGTAATAGTPAERILVTGPGVFFPMNPVPKCDVLNNFGDEQAVRERRSPGRRHRRHARPGGVRRSRTAY